MHYSDILQQLPGYIAGYVNNHKENVRLPYHNLQHTEMVVQAARQMAGHYQLEEADLFVVLVAAWFHDLGYYTGASKGHEEIGASLAAAFLQQNNVDVKIITAVKGCILATEMPQHPVTLLEKIVCDADLFHLGTDAFEQRNKLMRKECEQVQQREIGKQEWRAGTIELLRTHQYHTDYARLLLNDQKQKNLDALLKKQKNAAIAIASPGETAHAVPEKKAEKPVRGIETMFRVASTNHQRLSDMADSKAHIMISVNSIIISVVIGFVGRKLESAHNMMIPTLLLLIGCVTAVIFAVLATRPKIPEGYFTQEEVSKRTVNLLFFGNFYRMDFDQYYDGMKKVMADSEFLYGSLIRDVYSQGKVLGNKYKLLRVSYTVFMFTLIVSVLLFAIVFMFFNQ